MMLAFLALSMRKYLFRRVLLMSAGTPSTRLPLLGLYTIQSDLLGMAFQPLLSSSRG